VLSPLRFKKTEKKIGASMCRSFFIPLLIPDPTYDMIIIVSAFRTIRQGYHRVSISRFRQRGSSGTVLTVMN
jgi:hypothetical protein